jgi:anhydro-N-acetylmuramic acid kinase
VASATGARSAAILGSFIPGRGPLRLPDPAARPPLRIRVIS